MTTRDLITFGAEIDAVRRRVEAEIGPTDLAYIRRVARVSRGLEVVGRGLLHVAVEPVSFGIGVVALAAHKQLHGSEIGHAVLHGAFDRIPGAGRFRSRGYWWEMPVDEEAWREAHNIKHHQYTNVVGKDPDCRYGSIRLNEGVPHRPVHRHQWLHPLYVWPTFTLSIAAHVSGAIDLYGRQDGDWEIISDRTPATRRKVHRRFLRKAVPYYLKEYALFPALAGPMFWKVALGNGMAEVLRSVYSAATIFCGHVGEETAYYAADDKAGSRAQWYARQVESAHNFEVPKLLSILCGALDKQIEHHLFPRWPPNRLRDVAPEIQAICKRHGVRYQSDTWPGTLRKMFRQLRRLGAPTAATGSTPARRAA